MFESKERQTKVTQSGKRPGPALSPDPHCRRHKIYNSASKSFFFQRTKQGYVKIRAVNYNNCFRLSFNDHSGYRIFKSNKPRDRRYNFRKPHKTQFIHTLYSKTAFFFRLRTCHTPYFIMITCFYKFTNKDSCIVVTGGLSATYEDRQGLTPVTDIPYPSAVSIKSFLLRIIVLQASTARHFNPAFFIFSSVLFPTVGMSYLSSCPGFIILIRIPPELIFPALMIVSSVPSIASTATTERLWVTIDWPKERGRRTFIMRSPYSRSSN